MFSYTIAGVGSRVYAAVIDYLICLVAMIVLLAFLATLLPMGFISQSGSSEAWALAIIVFAQFFVLWGYYVIFEGLADGQTPGKRSLRLRVVRDGGYSVSFGASAVRNLVRILDMQPFFTYAVGIGAIVASKSGKRLGDMVAGTVHPIELFEFFHTLRRNNWTGVWQLDQFPFREDSVDAAKTAIGTLKRIHRALDRLDVAALAEAQERQDAMAAQRIVQDALFGAVD